MKPKRSFYEFDSRSRAATDLAGEPRAAMPVRSSGRFERIKSWAGIGLLWGGVGGVLLAPTNVLSFLPGLGLASRGGPWVVALLGGLEGAVFVGGMLALGAVLTRRRPVAAAADNS